MDGPGRGRQPDQKSVRSGSRVTRAAAGLHPSLDVGSVHSARTAKDAQRARWLLRGFDWLAMPDEIWDRAIDVQVQALHKGDHRALSMADLLIAATAERHGATVLHYDGDFDMIAAITGQAVAWVVPAGGAD